MPALSFDPPAALLFLLISPLVAACEGDDALAGVDCWELETIPKLLFPFPWFPPFLLPATLLVSEEEIGLVSPVGLDLRELFCLEGTGLEGNDPG